MTTKLLIGLGNVGQEYAKTRHNVGFMALDAFASAQGLQWQEKTKFKAFLAEYSDEGAKVILVKPTTFMNHSGEAARLLKDFYKIENENILVIHDELALPFATIRTRIGGSDAGNNGVKSLIQHIGPDFARIRVGIMDEEMMIMGAADFVLDRFDPEELTAMAPQFKAVSGMISDFLHGQFETTTQRHQA